MEKLVHKYLDSMAGDNPVLIKKMERNHYSLSNTFPVENFYVNDVRVGSKCLDVGCIMERKLGNTLKNLFNLEGKCAHRYFKSWINKLGDK